MKKLVVLNQFASTEKYSTGAGERFYYLMPHLKGYDVKVFSGSFNHLFANLPNAEGRFTKEKYQDGEFVWVRVSPYKSNLGRVRSWFQFTWNLYRFSWKEFKPDVVIVSSMSIFPVLLASYLKRRFGCRFIFEVRDIWPLTPIQLGGVSKYNPLMILIQSIENFALKKADAVVSVLPSYDDYIQRRGYHKLFKWIPNGVAPHGIEEGNKVVDLGGDSRFRVAYAGAFGIANAMEYVLESAKLLKDQPIQFIMIGDGPLISHYRKKYEDLVNITWINKVPKNEVNGLLKKMDAGIISWHDREIYKYGVSANKYNDYMMAGLPVISASSIPMDPILISGAGIQVNPEDPKAISEGILEVYNASDTRREEWKKNGKLYVAENTSYEILANKYLQLLNELG